MRHPKLAIAPALIVALACLAFVARGSDSGPGKAGAKPFDHRNAFQHLPPEDFLTYLPEKYAACIPCHPRVVFEEEDFNVDTNWRDTTMGKNLHGLHVYRQPDGVNCAVCHAWDEASGRIVFGSRINVKVTEKGGACTPACHRPKKYHNAGRL
ncbi:MAG TPA: hypothetical protein VIU29_01850 [Candidatus Deferrimicrobiaceae bacterium]